MMKIAKDKGNQDPALSDDKIERVERMYNEILKRIEERESKFKEKESQAETPSKGHDEL